MLLYFAGAESPSHLNTLTSEGVVRVAVNITALHRRVKDLSDWATEEKLGGLEWILYADSPDTPWDSALTVLNGAIAAGCPPEAIVGPASWGEDTWLGDSDLFFSPTWDGVDKAQLRHFGETYGSVFLPDTVIDNSAAFRSAAAAMAGHGQALGALTGRSKGLEQFDVVISSAWWAVQKHGETQVWDHGKLNRYNSKDKLTKRQQHRAGIEELGVDFDAVVADDAAAVARLAIRSWIMLERHMAPRPANRTPSGPVEVARDGIRGPLDDGSTSQRVDSDRPEGRHVVLPVIGLERMEVTHKDIDGTESSTTVESLAVTQESLRRCDTCSFSLQCPSYQAEASCAYHIPVIIRSKEQLQGVLRAMVEVQAQRVLMGRFGEEITGTPDPDVGREMDRLFGMVEKWKDIEDNRDTLEVSVKARGEMGMLSRLFGSKVGSNAMVLDTPVSSQAVIDKMTE